MLKMPSRYFIYDAKQEETKEMLLDKIVTNNRLKFYSKFYNEKRKGSWKGYLTVKGK